MSIESPIVFTGKAHALKATFVFMVQGPIERHRSQLASRETGDWITGTYSCGSLDRTKSVPKS